jgi:very-short-patch-repair endonuclease
VNFNRKHAIAKYIVDFCPVRKKLAIELDGSQHLKQSEYDIQRTVYLESQGYKVMRFWKEQVMKDVEGVIRSIKAVLDHG